MFYNIKYKDSIQGVYETLKEVEKEVKRLLNTGISKDEIRIFEATEIKFSVKEINVEEI